MLHIIETILTTVFIVWLSRAFEKFNRLKNEHKQHAKEFVRLIDDEDATDKKSYEDLSKSEKYR